MDGEESRIADLISGELDAISLFDSELGGESDLVDGEVDLLGEVVTNDVDAGLPVLSVADALDALVAPTIPTALHPSLTHALRFGDHHEHQNCWPPSPGSPIVFAILVVFFPHASVCVYVVFFAQCVLFWDFSKKLLV